MSGFFGVFSPSGNIDKKAFSQMQKAVHREGYDELETYVDDCIAMGHLMLRVTEESIHDKQPLRSTCGRYLLVGHFRLDYRDELGDKFGLTQKELEVTPDSTLAMFAYQKWSDKCVNHLEGDWSFVIYDNLCNSILCLKDKYGTSAIFYKTVGDQFIFATNIKLFYENYLTEKQIDYHQLYRLSYAGLEMEAERTLLKDVIRQSPCTYLVIDKSNNLNVYRYFEIIDFPIRKYKFEIDYFLNFRSLFSLAIKSKIRNLNRVGIFQSSGLDSNAILYFIANEMKYRSGFVYTYTSCNAYQDLIEEKYLPYVSDDLLFKESLSGYSNVIARFLDFKEVNFEDEFKASITEFDYPIVTKTKFWLKGILSKSKEDGVQIMFTGQLGNFTISWNRPKGLLFDFLKFKFVTVYKQLSSLHGGYKISFFRAFQVHIYKPLIYFLRYRFQLTLFSLNIIRVNSSLFSKPLVKRINYNLEWKGKESLLNIPLNLNPEELRKSLVKINGDVTGVRWYAAGYDNALLVNDPTIDNRLVNFLFTVPSALYVYKGIQKYLYRKTFEGRIYKPILNNDFTVQQTFDLAFRISSNSNFFKSFFNDLKGTELWQREPLVRNIENDYDNIFVQKNTLMKYKAAANFLNKFSILYIYIALNEK